MAGKNRISVAAALILAACFGAQRAQATVYTGNGATGFGGPVGHGSLSVTDNAAGDITFTFTPGAVHPSIDGNALVIYLSTGAAGITDTFPLSDIGDNGRRAISGYNEWGEGLDPTRSVLTFPSGFQATYGLAMEGGYVGLFQLPLAGGDGGLTWLTGASQSGYPLSVTFPLATLGLSQGQSFGLLGTLIDGAAAYRSNETIGNTDPDIGAGGNPGFNNLINFSSFFTYQTTPTVQTSNWTSTTGGSWSTASNWSAGVPNAAGAAAVFGDALASSAVITLDGDKTVGSISFNHSPASYTINAGSGGTITINNTGGASGSTAGFSVGSGSHVVAVPIQLAGGMTVNGFAGTQLTLSGGVGGSGDLNVTGNGTLTLSGNNTYSGNTVVAAGAKLNAIGSLPATALSASGTVTLGANTGAGILARSFSSVSVTGTGKVAVAAPSAAANRTLLVAGSLGFGGSTSNWEGLLDLGANDMIVRGGNVATLRSQLKQGLAGIAGITSSAAAASGTPKTAIGYAAVTANGTFDGQAVSIGDVVLKYTVVGDANLDSTVGFDDLLSLAQHYNNTGATWGDGDFNYDAVVDFSDLLSIAQNYNLSLSTSDLSQLDQTGGASFAGDWALARSLVPEPASLLGVAGLGLLARRRRA